MSTLICIVSVLEVEEEGKGGGGELDVRGLTFLVGCVARRSSRRSVSSNGSSRDKDEHLERKSVVGSKRGRRMSMDSSAAGGEGEGKATAPKKSKKAKKEVTLAIDPSIRESSSFSSTLALAWDADLFVALVFFQRPLLRTPIPALPRPPPKESSSTSTTLPILTTPEKPNIPTSTPTDLKPLLQQQPSLRPLPPRITLQQLPPPRPPTTTTSLPPKPPRTRSPTLP